MKARGAELIIITDKKELARDLDDNPILLPQNGPLTALTAIVPMQLIAYELALLRCVYLIICACCFISVLTCSSVSVFC